MLKVQTGVCINNVFAQSSKHTVARVGDPATVLFARDRHAATVIKVTPNTITVQQDKATRTDQNGMSESQSYTYERDPKGRIYRFWKTKKGWNARGIGLMIGEREEFYDYTF